MMKHTVDTDRIESIWDPAIRTEALTLSSMDYIHGSSIAAAVSNGLNDGHLGAAATSVPLE